MKLSDQIFKPERYTHKEYALWEGDWELINGYPIAMSPSPKRTHQWFESIFLRKAGNLIEQNSLKCDCEIYAELDWIVADDTVVRPDCMIVCGKFTDDFLNFPPNLILEVSSHATRLRDRNTKYTLYEMYGVKYYIIADGDKKTVEVFELIDNKYKQTDTTEFKLTNSCSINLDVLSLWDLVQ